MFYTISLDLQKCLFIGFLLAGLTELSLDVHAQTKPTREEKVRADRAKVEAAGFWIYNDLQRAREQAKKTGQPLLVNFRCIPCEECVKLDDDLVDRDPILRSLLDKFVCVRVVSTNGLDLSTFQFDTDQSFGIFLMNSDGEIYGRFGTRSHRTDWVGDVSLEGMARALEGALELHDQYPANRESLQGKKGKPLEFDRPEKYPKLASKYKAELDSSKPVMSCIHCHQIGDARRDYYRSLHQPIPEELLFSYPHPKILGVVLDPKTCATVQYLEPNSAAELAGIKEGDVILSMEGQPILSMADVQWVLHRTPPGPGKISVVLERDGKEIGVMLELAEGWRRKGDLSWRASSWGLRRMVTGGMVLEVANEEARTKFGIAEGRMSLVVSHVGEYAPHRAAQDAGFRKGDVLVQFDGRDDLLTESDLFAYAINHLKSGAVIDLDVLRNGERLTLSLPMQD